MAHTRRAFIMGIATLCAVASPGYAILPVRRLKMAIQSPWMANQIAITRGGKLFLGLPRYSAELPTPSLARRGSDGQLHPFPGNKWNTWQPGEDGREAFVYLNSVHVFSDETVWCVDQGSLGAGIFGEQYARPLKGAQKIVQLDANSGKILRILRFDETILPQGAQMNDLRIHGTKMYVSDSGLGGIIIHDLLTGETKRRLSGMAVVKASNEAPPALLAHVKGGKVFHPPNSDMIEITADGRWLYWAAPTGPLYRIETRLLWNKSLSDDELSADAEAVFDNAFSGGCAMDTQGNIYFSETATHKITVWSPTGRTAVLITDPRLNRPDGSCISGGRSLYIPEKQPVRKRNAAGIEEQVFCIYEVDLPESIGGISLGAAVG